MSKFKVYEIVAPSVMAKYCEVGYSTTLAKAQAQNFESWGKVFAVEGSECKIKWQTEKKPDSHSTTNVFLPAFHSIPSSDSASKAPLYLQSDHEASDPKKSLRSAAQHNTHTQSDPGRLFLLISSEVSRATDVAVLQCLTAIVFNSLQPCIPTQQVVHFLRLSQYAQSVPSSRFLAQTIIRCTKTCERWFSSTTHSVHNLAHNLMVRFCSFQMSSHGGST